jgi:Tol biopolymer transport system component/tRNA A-37 threonylcarbamoyl transferase component Bud32
MTDVLGRLGTALADRYRIERELGAGGMATVYLAHDVRHDRRVALKVLRPELASILGGERFLSEIKTTANLQHPHILPLHDSGEADGLVFYVMPYVEGESLRDRLTREKQLPVDDAIRIATEVAGALAYAHRHGVVHRDIKPENILLHEGQALVADFGIALAASRSDGGTRMTETGMSLGTPHYMAPEQAMGEREITAKADIYALGCVLYEMLTGEPPFTGPTAQAIVARVMTEEPRSLTLQRHTVPAQVEAATRKALEKLPADRFPTAEAFAEALANPAFSAQGPGVQVAAAAIGRRAGLEARLRDPFVVVPSLACVAALAVAIGLSRRKAPAAIPPISYVLATSDSTRPVENFPWPATISPDGGTIVYTAASGANVGMLFALRADQLEPHALPGTASAYQPYFSPDGTWLAFEQSGKERKVRLDGSQPVTITSAGGANGATWTVRDKIVLGAQGPFHGLSIVSAAGGDAVALTRPDTARGERDHLWPIGSPDGRSVVFTIWTGSNASSRLAVASIPGGRVTPLGIAGIRPLAVLDGALVYVQADGAVMAVRLSGSLRKVEGQPFPVHDPVPVTSGLNGNSEIYVSRGGAMVTSRGGQLGRLVWLGPGGRTDAVVPGVRAYASPRIAPDGKRIAVVVLDDGKSDIWIYDPALSTFSKLTNLGTVTSVEWSADGSRVIYAATGEGRSGDVWSQPVTGGSAAERLFGEPYVTPAAALSPDGRSLLVVSVTTAIALVRVALDSSRAAQPYAVTPANALSPRFSPDGRWVALTSDESGRDEVYVRSFPDPAARIQVSVSGGGEPVWSADGTRLYYRAGDALIAARVTLSPTFRLVSRDTVLTKISAISAFFSASYDVTRDGKRVLAIAPQSNDFQLVVAPNWITEFRRRVAESRGQ